MTETTGKRTKNVLSWDEYFMSVAFLSGQRSKDPVTQVGACIVNADNRIISVGYNGMPNGCSDDKMPWGKDSKNAMKDKHSFVCHAELNAIVNKLQADIRGCKMYVSLHPCHECAKLIIQSGIKEVIFFSDKYHERELNKVARRLFNDAGVTTRKYTGRTTKVVIDFKAIEAKCKGVKKNNKGGHRLPGRLAPQSEAIYKRVKKNNKGGYQLRGRYHHNLSKK